MKERIPELIMPITEIEYLRIDIRLQIPGVGQTLTYGLYEDARLFPLKRKYILPEDPIEHPLEFRQWCKEEDLRRELMSALAAKIAYAIYHADEEKETQ